MQKTEIHETIKLQILDEVIFEVYVQKKVQEKQTFQKLKNQIYKKYAWQKPIAGIAFLERYQELIDAGTLLYEPRLHRLFRKRAIRSLSGVAVISLLTKFWGCPGKCVFCPTYEGLPKSYISNEPAVMRAQLNEFDTVKQVHNRLRGLEITGHNITKCDVRVIGGTWSFYPQEYQESVIKDIYDAHSYYEDLRPFIIATSKKADKFATFKLKTGYKKKSSLSLEEAKQKNQTACSRVIGIAIETRPDWINELEIKRLRRYGVTRVEIGYQTTDDEINIINKRGHTNAASIHATQLLKDAGYKVVAHMMPNLLGSTPKKDVESLQEIFHNQNFRPDELKIYPMVVTPHSEIEKIWQQGRFTPYDDETLLDILSDIQGFLPEYVRLNRMYRDIPASEILAGSKMANLRQMTEKRMKEKGITPADISAREVRAKLNDPHKAILESQEYEASKGKEYFFQFIDPHDKTIFSLLRLRIPSQIFLQKPHFLKELQHAALIRELHTFGDQLRVGESANGTGQHMGFGKKLLFHAEKIIQEKYPEIKKLAVISGVGVRPYYEKRGYHLEGEYMVKYREKFCKSFGA